MQVTAKAEYALRAATVLAGAGPGPVKSEAIASAEDIPLRFLHNILAALTRAGILSSLRGADGGYELTREAATITVADVIRAVEGPFAAGGGPDAPPAAAGAPRAGHPPPLGTGPSVSAGPPSGPSWSRSPWPTWPPAGCPI
jgi:Rrf2 family protein